MIHEDLEGLSVPIDSVIPHPRNVREGDVGAISESLRLNGQYRPIVIQKSTNHILAGNHTWKAAKSLGWESIAVTYVDVDDEKALRILLVDNHTNDLAHYNEKELTELLKELVETDSGLEGTGYDEDELDELLQELKDPDEFYTNLIKAPQYEIVGDEPDISELVNMNKVHKLYSSIAEHEIPEEIRNFLHAAAWRHAKFNYRKIAEFYPHQTPEVQRLMEESVLIIIDAKDAIANGYLTLQKQLDDLKKLDDDEE